VTGGEREDVELVADGRKLRFPAIWLRDNCPCGECQDAGSGQKFNDLTDIPAGVAVAAVQDAGDRVVVTFAPDRHRSAFSRRWLAEHALDGYGDGDGRTEDDKELWRPAGCSTSGSSRRRETLPSPAARSGRTPTTPTAIRCRPCSCCTACAPR
jgi:DUF971 family protein